MNRAVLLPLAKIAALELDRGRFEACAGLVSPTTRESVNWSVWPRDDRQRSTPNRFQQARALERDQTCRIGARYAALEPMIFVIAFGVLALAFLGLHLIERRRGGKTDSTERDLYAMKDGAAFGGIVGQAQMHKLDVPVDETTVREDLEPIKFKFDN